MCNFTASAAELKIMILKETDLSFVNCSPLMDLYIAV